MKDFFKVYTAWILVVAFLTYGLMMLWALKMQEPTFETFNKGEIVCFHTKEPTCYKLINIK